VKYTDIAGDVSAASAAFGGLVLVFLGAASERFHSFSVQQQKVVKLRFQIRAWLAFFGVAFSLGSTGLALYAKYSTAESAAAWSLLLLGAAASVVLVAALLIALDVK
jgi:hypothetical protein